MHRGISIHSQHDDLKGFRISGDNIVLYVAVDIR